MTRRGASRTFTEDVAHIGKVGWCVALFITLPTLGLQALVVKLLGAEEALTILQIMAFTAPLTLAILVISVITLFFFSDADMADSFRITGMHWLGVLSLVAVIFAGTLKLCSMLGLGVEGADLDAVWEETLRNRAARPTRHLPLPASFIYYLLATYWEIYGPWSFISSIVVALFLAWALCMKLLPYLIADNRKVG